ncbi:MAG: uroporphyrinogen decarboxylase family protein [Anaerolineae bacterium]
MNHRERILAVIRHEPVDRLPTDLWATHEVFASLYDHFGVETVPALYDALDIDGIMNIAPPYIGPLLKKEGDYFENVWGMGYRSQVYPTGVYHEQVYWPLAEAQTIADLQAYRWPSPDWYDYSALPALAAQYEGRAIECGYSAVFFYHNLLRGLELSLVDPYLNPDLTRYIVDRISEFFDEYHRRCFEAAPGLIDITQVTDDWGSQTGLLTSPAVFEAYYQPAMQSAMDLAKAHGIIVFHHDDGDMRPLLPTLVEMGIDVLNPIQWRCGNWDLAALKAAYAGRLCFHGAVDNQETLPFGTPDDVRAEVKRLIETLGSDGTGYIVAPCHNLQPNTSIANILALYEAARDYGTLQ